MNNRLLLKLEVFKIKFRVSSFYFILVSQIIIKYYNNVAYEDFYISLPHIMVIICVMFLDSNIYKALRSYAYNEIVI